MESNRVKVFDTTLRDGEQSPGCSMFLDEKVEIARQLELLGVDVIEAGFPIASDGDFQAVRAVSAECTSATVAAAVPNSRGRRCSRSRSAEGCQLFEDTYVRCDV